MKYLKKFEEKEYFEVDIQKLWDETVIEDEELNIAQKKYSDINFIDLLKEMVINKVVKFTFIGRVIDETMTTKKIDDIKEQWEDDSYCWIYFIIKNEKYKLNVTDPIQIYNHVEGPIEKKLNYYRTQEKFGL